jgi:EAL domain-containing protein (putative c-di-GMP-specific phosphodiesterase class I)
MPEPIPVYHERLPEIEKELTERGHIGLLVLDASPLALVEDQYGTEAYAGVRERVFKILDEQRGKDYRNGDILALDRPRGLRFLFFLERKRRRQVASSVADMKAGRGRLMASLVGNLARASHPFLKRPPKLDVGYGVAVQNPLLHPGRIVERAIEEALAQAANQRRTEEQLVLERLLDILLQERVRVDYQPILRMKEGTVMGFEALARGPRGSGLETAEALFGAATRHNLFVELDRLCRRRALLSTGRVPTNAKVFVNTLHATMRDPQFRGKPLIDLLEKAQISPDRIVIEITEKDAIDNYHLFRDNMANFTDLGMTFAVDDVGAGYSGLESIARLKPSYLKIDTDLVRDVNTSMVNKAMVKAIITLGHGIGATVVAEGIQSEDEAQTLRAMGVDFGQGYYLARPIEGNE